VPRLKPATIGFELSGFSWSFRLTLQLYARSVWPQREPVRNQGHVARILSGVLRRDPEGRHGLRPVSRERTPRQAVSRTRLPPSSKIRDTHSIAQGYTGMTVAEAADALGVSTQTIYNRIYAGKLRARRPANRYILRESDVANLAARPDRHR
jgi:excisionase family DNA binding protein